VIFDPLNSGSHLEISSSSLMRPRSTNVMSVAVLSHFVDDATDIGVAPDTATTACSWIAVPSSAMIRIIPPDNPADSTRLSRNAAVLVNVPGKNTLPTAPVVGTAV